MLSDDPADIVFGELYRLRERDALLHEFDMYEACGEVFRSRPNISAGCCRHARRRHAGEAWTYVYNWPVTGLPRIASGKFLEK